MSTQASNWFDTVFPKLVARELQSGGFMTRGMTRDSDNISGNVVRWRRSGKASVSPHPAGWSDTAMQDVTRDYVEATLQDYDADVWTKVRDLEKMSVDEQTALVMETRDAIGRKYDELVLDEVATAAIAASQVGGAADGSLKNPALLLTEASKIYGEQLNLGKVNCAVPVMTFANFMNYKQFADSQWVGTPGLAQSSMAKSWMGVNIFAMEDKFFTDRRPATGTNNVYLYMWHSDCVGRVTNAISLGQKHWIPEKKGWMIDNSLSSVCKTIVTKGVRVIQGAQDTSVTFS